ncbi:MAG: phage tail protein [Clostridiales bacterium]|jgi:hypothetical protein|nr:phage tail protein [Clostridiales bacterium]
MGEIGQFGDIIFEVSGDKIITFNGFKRETSSKYENHELIAQKPRTEFIAPGLDTVSFTVTLNFRFGVSPRDEMNRWIEHARSGDAERLVVGGKAIGVDKWIITSVSQAWDVIYDGGVLAFGKVDVSLQEYCSEMWTVSGYESGKKSQSKTADTIAQLEKDNSSQLTPDNPFASMLPELEDWK